MLCERDCCCSVRCAFGSMIYSVGSVITLSFLVGGFFGVWDACVGLAVAVAVETTHARAVHTLRLTVGIHQ